MWDTIAVRHGINSNRNMDIERQLINFKIEKKIKNDLLQEYLFNSDNTSETDNVPQKEGDVTQQITTDDLLGQFDDLLNEIIDYFTSILNNDQLIMGFDKLKLSDGSNMKEVKQSGSRFERLSMVFQLIKQIIQQYLEYWHDLSNLNRSQEDHIKRIESLVFQYIDASNFEIIKQEVPVSKKESQMSKDNELLIMELKSKNVRLENELHEKDVRIDELKNEVESLKNLINTKISNERNEAALQTMMEYNDRIKLQSKLYTPIDGDVHHLIELNNDANGGKFEGNFLEKLDARIHIQQNIILNLFANEELLVLKYNELIKQYIVLQKANKALNKDLNVSLSKFKKLINLEIETMDYLLRKSNENIDEESLAQAFERLHKVRSQITSVSDENSSNSNENANNGAKSINYDKIFHYWREVNNYFEQLFDTIIDNHKQIDNYSKKKQKDDLETINDLNVKINKFKLIIKGLRDELGFYKEEYNRLESTINNVQGGNNDEALRAIHLAKKWIAERESRVLELRSYKKKLSEMS